MSCPSIHCACCAGGITVPVVPIAAAFGHAWIAEHLVEVIAVCGMCGALAVAASIAPFRWASRRDDRRLAPWRLSQARAAPQIPTVRTDSVTSAERPARSGSVTCTCTLTAGPEQADVIRQALSGQPGDAITKGELPPHEPMPAGPGTGGHRTRWHTCPTW